MDALFRFLLYAVLGSLLILLDIWFIRTAKRTFFETNAVITPFRVIGKDDPDAKLGTTLAYMLQAQLRQIQADMIADQQSPVEIPSSSQEAVTQEANRSHAFFSRTSLEALTIPSDLLEPIDINVDVGGVEVGGIFPWLQRLFIDGQTLDFSVSYEDNQAIVVGNLNSIGINETLWQETTETTPDGIAKTVAYAIVKMALSNNQVNEIEALDLTEFRTLLTDLDKISHLNQQAVFEVVAVDAYEPFFNDIEPVAVKMPRWAPLLYLAADLAEKSGLPSKAVNFYQQLKTLPDQSQEDMTWLDGRIHGLTPETGNANEKANQKIEGDLQYAVDFLNEMFGETFTPPILVSEDSTNFNGWVEDGKYHAPPDIQYLPDITYHEVSYRYIATRVDFEFQGQSGAIMLSYGDVFASLIRQKQLGQTAETADWIIAPGGIAWLHGEDIPTSTDKSGIRSFKAPGTAYINDPNLGTDPQRADMAHLYTGALDNGGVHINSGIPNKAFYETAIQLRSDRAGQIWFEALSKLKPDSQFQDLARATYDVARSTEKEAVKKAWETVGISVEAEETSTP